MYRPTTISFRLIAEQTLNSGHVDDSFHLWTSNSKLKVTHRIMLSANTCLHFITSFLWCMNSLKLLPNFGLAGHLCDLSVLFYANPKFGNRFGEFVSDFFHFENPEKLRLVYGQLLWWIQHFLTSLSLLDSKGKLAFTLSICLTCRVRM